MVRSSEKQCHHKRYRACSHRYDQERLVLPGQHHRSQKAAGSSCDIAGRIEHRRESHRGQYSVRNIVQESFYAFVGDLLFKQYKRKSADQICDHDHNDKQREVNGIIHWRLLPHRRHTA